MRNSKSSQNSRRKYPKPAQRTPAEKRKVQKVHKELSDMNIGILSKDKKIKTIYVGNLSYQKKPYDIKDLFKKYGEVSYVRLVMDKQTCKSRGIAFVQMPDSTSTKKAINELNGAEIDGRTLKVSIAKDR